MLHPEKSRRAAIAFASVLIFALFAGGSDRLQAQALQILDTPNAGPQGAAMAAGAMAEVDAAPWLIRKRPIVLRLDPIREADPGVGSIIRIDLFDGEFVEGRIDLVQRRDPDDFSWVGSLIGVEGRFYLSFDGNIGTGMVDYGVDTVYQIAVSGPETLELRQLDPAMAGLCGNDESTVVPPPAAASQEPSLQGVPAAADASTQFDILVVYTAAARLELGGTAAIQTAITNAVNKTNICYANSLVNTSARLVHMAEISYAEDNSLNTSLNRVTDIGDGYMEEAHTLRNAYGADFVVLVQQAADPGNIAGLGWLINLTPSINNDIYAFSVCQADQLWAHVFPHEVGHNQGCAHDRDNAGSNGLYSYSYGWRFFGTNAVQYRTVMAYDPGTRIDYFSNPNVSYQGTATGVAVGQANESHNAQTINNVASTFANYRQAVNSTISIEPDDEIPFNGPWGGPFVGTGTEVNLRNLSSGTINWTATIEAIGGIAAFQASPSGGVLAASAVTPVTFSATAAAGQLAPGSYDATVTFTDTTNGISRHIELTLVVRPVLSFGFSTIPSPQFAGVPFGATITARDSMGLPVPGFTGTVSLGALTPSASNTFIQDGPTASNLFYDFPFFTLYETFRSSHIYLASELGGQPGEIHGLSLYTTWVPGLPMNNWTVRLKTTSLSSFSGSSWDNTDWTTAYQTNLTVSQTGWVHFTLPTPFAYNGTSNLMVDFSFRNGVGQWEEEYGFVSFFDSGSNRTRFFFADNVQGYGDPLTWSTFTPSGLDTEVPTIRLEYNALQIVDIEPETSGAFSGGSWTGNLTIPAAAATIQCAAAAVGFGGGISNVFAVDPADFTTVWLDFAWGGSQAGTEANPFQSLATAIGFLEEGGTLKIKAGGTGETARITKPMRIESEGGSARIGAE